jgi:hypothetical protein
MFEASLEGVYTDPFLYLRSRNAGAQTVGSSGINFVVANDQGIFSEHFMGYRWGGDAIVVNTRAEYKRFGAWSGGVNFLYMLHGTHDKWTVYSPLYGSGNHPHVVPTPTDTHETGNHADANADECNAPYTLLALSLFCSWTPPRMERLSLHGSLDFIHLINPFNKRENPPASDLQVTIGLRYRFL